MKTLTNVDIFREPLIDRLGVDRRHLLSEHLNYRRWYEICDLPEAFRLRDQAQQLLLCERQLGGDERIVAAAGAIVMRSMAVLQPDIVQEAELPSPERIEVPPPEPLQNGIAWGWEAPLDPPAEPQDALAFAERQVTRARRHHRKHRALQKRWNRVLAACGLSLRRGSMPGGIQTTKRPEILELIAGARFRAAVTGGKHAQPMAAAKDWEEGWTVMAGTALMDASCAGPAWDEEPEDWLLADAGGTDSTGFSDIENRDENFLASDGNSNADEGGHV